MGHVLADKSLIVKHPFTSKYTDAITEPVEMGAVYYRRSNPPEYDWDRDYKVAREDGCTQFRHWFTWNAIHIAPDTFDFGPYDKHLELAVKYGIKTVIAEHIYEAPDWMYHKYPAGRRELADGNTFSSMMGDSNATGITRMCLDNEDVMREAKNFLSALAKHYRDNPGLYGYDIWNECSLYNAKEMCYCPATQKEFRLWLREKYDDNLDKVREAWRRYGISQWDDIELPRRIQPYPDTIDMLHFRNDSAQKWMKMRHDTIREIDKKAFIIAHGNAKTFCDLPACGDDFRPVEFVDIYGYTFWYGNHCHTMLGSDMIRIASSGKEFWRAEAIGNSDWQARGGFTTPIAEKEVMADPANIRLDAMMSFVAGSRGFINPRWRALQDGGLFDGYGWYNLDGTRSVRSEEVKHIAKWANNKNLLDLWRAQPVRGEVGLVLLEDSQFFCYSFYDNTDYYSLAYQGAYEALLDSGIQADPILLQHIDEYKILYLPFPVSLGDAAVEKITKWVEKGGTLIVEGCFGYFSATGHAFEHQPSRGLDAVCGVKQDTVSFGPDMWHGLEFTTAQGSLGGGVYRQSYTPSTGKAAGAYSDGGISVVENNYGKGKVRIVGTMAGYGYKLNPKQEYLHFFASILPFAGKVQLLRTDFNSGLIARIWASDSKTFLWVLNTRKYTQNAVIGFNADILRFNGTNTLRGSDAKLDGGFLKFEVPGRDAAVFELF
jgi:beta-galactosidase